MNTDKTDGHQCLMLTKCLKNSANYSYVDTLHTLSKEDNQERTKINKKMDNSIGFNLNRVLRCTLELVKFFISQRYTFPETDMNSNLKTSNFQIKVEPK